MAGVALAMLGDDFSAADKDFTKNILVKDLVRMPISQVTWDFDATPGINRKDMYFDPNIGKIALESLFSIQELRSLGRCRLTRDDSNSKRRAGVFAMERGPVYVYRKRRKPRISRNSLPSSLLACQISKYSLNLEKLSIKI